MWLIDVESYELKSFPTHNTWRYHPYAILSHTWGEEEVTFQDMNDLVNARRKTGFWKIAQTCEEAKRCGLAYAWVDTCCIDKSSSAELQEAINSMFQWYARAQVCFAYLADVNVNDHGEMLGAEFRSSRWFSRGWTLQEMIAPRTLIFFSKGWTRIGTRAKMKSLIARKTGVDSEILETGISPVYNYGHGDAMALIRFSVAKRMSWAAHRETTRIEDRAYSLLGIFGVSMPLLYGEGSRAFIRLQEEILRTSPDLSLLLWEHPEEEWCGQYTSDTDDNYQGLLAPSPDNFDHCGHFTHVLTDDFLESTASRNVSSIGMQARLRVMFDPGLDVTKRKMFGILVILNSFDGLDPTTTVALCARLMDKDGGGLAMTNRPGDDVNETLYLILPAGVFNHHRIEKIDAIKAEYESELRNVVLLRSAMFKKYNQRKKERRPIEFTEDYTTAVRGVDHVWLRLEFPQRDPKWTVTQVYPEKSWRLDPPTFDATKCFDNVFHSPWFDDRVTAGPRESIPVNFLVGAIALQREDFINSTAVIVIACLITGRGQQNEDDDGYLRFSGHRQWPCPVYFSLSAGEGCVPKNINEDIERSFLRSSCQEMMHSMSQPYPHYWRILPDDDQPPFSGRSVEVGLYEGTRVYDGSAICIREEYKIIGNSMIAVLHASDPRSSQVE